jgi:hypothetical protein
MENTQDATATEGCAPAAGYAERVVRPRAGDTWRFPMVSDSGRRVWWTRKLTFINDGWAHWKEANPSKRDQTLVTVLMEGTLVSRPNAGSDAPGAVEKP